MGNKIDDKIGNNLGPLQLQQAATSGNGTEIQLEGVTRDLAIYINWSAGVGAGKIQIETAIDKGYTGTWAPLGSAINGAGGDKQDIVQVAGPIRAIRARISNTVTGGTVSVQLQGV